MIETWKTKLNMGHKVGVIHMDLSKVFLNDIKVLVFFGKNIEKRHLYRHDKNYYYFWKSNIPVINWIVNSKHMIKVSKNMSL